MIQAITSINSPVRQIKAKAELYNGSALVNTFYTDLVELSIERKGEEGKFFGFGICQRLNIKLIDINREKDITTANSFKVYFDNICNFPYFTTTEVNRDENTNQLSITAYDALKKAEAHNVEELGLPTSYTILDFAVKVADFLGVNGINLIGIPNADISFSLSYADGANFEGTETLKAALTAIAEATQTVYYLDGDNTLVFKRFNKDAVADLVIDRASYILLDSKTNRKLQTISNTTELGDEVSASIAEIGTTQFIRDNPFLELREDIADILDNAIATMGGLTINQFSCSWRGNYLLECGDKIELITKDGGSAFSYVINDTINYNGAFSQSTSWSYIDGNQTATNPTTLGQALKQTFAKVDKAEKRIDIVAGETSANNSSISSIQADTENINLIVEKIEKKQEEDKEALEGSIETLTNRVDLAMTSEDVTIAIQSELDNGVAKVATEKGFIFDNAGLTIEERDSEGNRISETSTQITENGMQVFDNNDEAVLTANNNGVNAVNLHATTYLIIGNNSRFEDYGDNRTGCFWIGGNN